MKKFALMCVAVVGCVIAGLSVAMAAEAPDLAAVREKCCVSHSGSWNGMFGGCGKLRTPENLASFQRCVATGNKGVYKPPETPVGYKRNKDGLFVPVR